MVLKVAKNAKKKGKKGLRKVQKYHETVKKAQKSPEKALKMSHFIDKFWFFKSFEVHFMAIWYQNLPGIFMNLLCVLDP